MTQSQLGFLQIVALGLGFNVNVALGSKLHLATAFPADLNWLTDPADITEADFAGYAAIVITTYWDRFHDALELAEVSHLQPQTFTWSGTPGDPGNSIVGFYITDVAGTGLLAAGRFDRAMPMSASPDLLVLELFFASQNLARVLAVCNGVNN